MSFSSGAIVTRRRMTIITTMTTIITATDPAMGKRKREKENGSEGPSQLQPLLLVKR
jgi:hypothetical protein